MAGWAAWVRFLSGRDREEGGREESKRRGTWRLSRKGVELLSVKTDRSQVGRHDGLVKYDTRGRMRKRK